MKTFTISFHERPRETFLFIKEYKRKYDATPTRRQIANYLQVSIPVASWEVNELKKRGYIDCIGTKRTIKLLKDNYTDKL